MKSISGKQFAKLVEQKGWHLVRIQGSHHIYCKLDNPACISIPIHGNKDIKIGLLRYLMKQVGISENEL